MSDRLILLPISLASLPDVFDISVRHNERKQLCLDP